MFLVAREGSSALCSDWAGVKLDHDPDFSKKKSDWHMQDRQKSFYYDNYKWALSEY